MFTRDWSFCGQRGQREAVNTEAELLTRKQPRLGQPEDKSLPENSFGLLCVPPLVLRNICCAGRCCHVLGTNNISCTTELKTTCGLQVCQDWLPAWQTLAVHLTSYNSLSGERQACQSDAEDYWHTQRVNNNACSKMLRQINKLSHSTGMQAKQWTDIDKRQLGGGWVTHNIAAFKHESG